MKIKNIFKTSLLSMSLMTMTACIGDLDQNPIDPDSFTELDVYESVETSKGAFGKLYTAIALNGQFGWTFGDDNDLDVPDGGASQYTRLLFNLQTLTTDEGVNGWGDGTLQGFVNTNWASDNDYNKMLYDRLGQSVIFCSEFIKNESKFKGDPEADLMITEARFLRAYHYYNLLDAYGNIPIQLEITNDLPTQNSPKEVFEFIESELLTVKDELPTSNEYGRVDKTAATALLSRLYLNAELFIGVDHYDEAVQYSQETIDSKYNLHTNYQELFLSDNNRNGAEQENIFVIRYDGLHTTTAGGTSFFIHANFGGVIPTEDFGSNGGWGGNRSTQNLVSKFEASTFDSEDYPITWYDQRALFWTEGQNYIVEEIPPFTDGYAVTKWKNIDSDGNYTAVDASMTHSDIDLALIRMGEIYLNYAEAVLRGGNGSRALALKYVNDLRERAYGNTNGNIEDADLTLDFLIDERSRELYWEGTRRTDLKRFDLFTGGAYLWPFKAGYPGGSSIPEYRALMPIPSQIILANPNLKQNPGY